VLDLNYLPYPKKIRLKRFLLAVARDLEQAQAFEHVSEKMRRDGQTECHCWRCGWVWRSRVEGRPLACPKCKRRDWDRERVKRVREVIRSAESAEIKRLRLGHSLGCACGRCA
jgi:predicted Zn-ribbon and HTH transcriptional regulator